MAYNQFTLETVVERFRLKLQGQADAFSTVPPASVSAHLRQALHLYSSLAQHSGTEKARSEFLVAPVLSEVWQQSGRKVMVFSRVDFPVDPAEALGALGDFLLNLTPVPLVGDAPVIMIVEAKREDVERGLGQCLAELVAAQRFNAARGRPIPVVYGAVTTGFNWRFVTLSERSVVMDLRDYSLAEVDRIVGILIQMVAWASAAAAPGSDVPDGRTLLGRTESERECAPEGAAAP